MYTAFIRTAIVSIILLWKPSIATIPAGKYSLGRYVDCAALANGGPDDIIGGIYLSDEMEQPMTYAEIGIMIQQAARDATACAKVNPLPNGKERNLPEGVTVYQNGNRDVVIAAIGGGDGRHGEENVKILCESSGVAFDGGKIVTYAPRLGEFRPACRDKEVSSGLTATRNCLQLIKDVDIKDIAVSVKAVTVIT